MSRGATTEGKQNSIQLDESAVAVEIRANLFHPTVTVAAGSTSGESRVLIAKPWRVQNSEVIHLANIYRQNIGEPRGGDESSHLGAADLRLDPNVPDELRGEYWTRRNWQTGMNTGGTIELRRCAISGETNKSLLDFARAERDRDAAEKI